MTIIPVQRFHGLSKVQGESEITCSCGETFTATRDATKHQIEGDREVANFNACRPALASAIDTLNRLHEADPSVLPALIAHRVRCNEAVADDPTIQVSAIPAVQPGSGSEPQDGYFEVGFLGILNGIFGIRSGTQGHIAAVYDDDGKLTHFEWTGAK